MVDARMSVVRRGVWCSRLYVTVCVLSVCMCVCVCVCVVHLHVCIGVVCLCCGLYMCIAVVLSLMGLSLAHCAPICFPILFLERSLTVYLFVPSLVNV